jgi:hypothetical protein
MAQSAERNSSEEMLQQAIQVTLSLLGRLQAIRGQQMLFA